MATLPETNHHPKRVHHINFVVRDLEQAIERYELILGRPVTQRESLPARGKLARFDVDGIWIVLVQPLDDDSEPGRHLARYGEGFFLLSFEVDQVEAAGQRLQRLGLGLMNEQPRQGLENWQVLDVDPKDACGVLVQLCEERVRQE